MCQIWTALACAPGQVAIATEAQPKEALGIAAQHIPDRFGQPQRLLPRYAPCDDLHRPWERERYGKHRNKCCEIFCLETLREIK